MPHGADGLGLQPAETSLKGTQSSNPHPVLGVVAGKVGPKIGLVAATFPLPPLRAVRYGAQPLARCRHVPGLVALGRHGSHRLTKAAVPHVVLGLNVGGQAARRQLNLAQLALHSLRRGRLPRLGVPLCKVSLVRKALSNPPMEGSHCLRLQHVCLETYPVKQAGQKIKREL